MRHLLFSVFAVCVAWACPGAADAAPTKAQLKEVADEARGIMSSARKPSKASVANLIRGLNKSMKDGKLGFFDAIRIIRRLRPVLNEANVSAVDLLKLRKDIQEITGRKMSKADLENLLKVVLPVINTAYPELKQ